VYTRIDLSNLRAGRQVAELLLTEHFAGTRSTQGFLVSHACGGAVEFLVVVVLVVVVVELGAR